MNYPYSRFTMTYQEVVDLDTTIPELMSFGDDTKDKAIRDMVMDMYWNWEIAGETIGEFKNMLQHSFNTVKDYYNELIDAYQTKIDMLDGRKTVITRDTTNTDKKTETTASTTHGSNTNDALFYDLPRSTTSENRPSTKTDKASSTDNSGTATFTADNVKNIDATITTIGGENVIKLKKDYMKLIRNVYYDCAMELRKCFLDLFY